MKYTKTSIGEVAFLETNANYKDSLKKIPKEARVMEAWELQRVFKKEPEKLKDFPMREYIWTENYTACLYWLGSGSRCDAGVRNVDDSYWLLRGICIIKKVKQ
jgi:hypothetical protein